MALCCPEGRVTELYRVDGVQYTFRRMHWTVSVKNPEKAGLDMQRALWLRQASAVLAIIVGGWAQADEVSFHRDVRPILSASCFKCHGFDGKSRQGDLRLDTAAGAAQALKATQPQASALWQRIFSSDVDEVMPPAGEHRQLSPAEKETLRQWLEQGGQVETHWAFEPIVRHQPPALESAPVAWQRRFPPRWMPA